MQELSTHVRRAPRRLMSRHDIVWLVIIAVLAFAAVGWGLA